MAGVPVEVQIEALFRWQIRMVRKKLDEIRRLEEEAAIGETALNPELYTRRRELVSYINHYRIVLEQLRRYGPQYLGHNIEESWLMGLDELERKVFLERFCRKKSFREIARQFNIAEPHKVYECAYRKVLSNIPKV